MYNLLDLIFVRDVTLYKDGVAPVMPNFIRAGGSNVLVPIYENNFGSFATEDFGYALADSPGRTRDDRDLVF